MLLLPERVDSDLPTRRILIVEDEALVATLLSEALEQVGFDVSSAPDVLSAKRLVRTFDPDVALLDVNLGPGPTGLDLAHYLDRVHPDVALVLLTRHPDHRSVGLEAPKIPPRAGFLRKDLVSDVGTLLASINDVMRDRGSAHRHDRFDDRPLRALTVRQLAVLRLAARGMSNVAIARERGITERAVEKLLQSALQALGVPDHPDLNRRVDGIRRFVAAAGLPDAASTSELDRADRTPDA